MPKKSRRKMPKKSGRKKRVKAEKAQYVIIGILAVVVIFLIFQNLPSKNTSENPRAVMVLDSSCNDCFDLKSLADGLSKSGFAFSNVKKVEFSSGEGKKLVSEYSLNFVPALLIFSESQPNQIFEKRSDAWVFDKAVPGISTNSLEKSGQVKIIEVQAASCSECASISRLKKTFEEVGVKIVDYEIVQEDSQRGRKLIEENGLEILPSALLSKEISDYWWIFEQLKDSFKETGDYFVLASPSPPNKNIKSGKISGLVEATYVEDSKCGNCTKAKDISASIKSMGIYFKSETSVELNSVKGQNLVKKYNLSFVPTIILSKEISEYPQFKAVLEAAGTTESDGAFVLRKLDPSKVNLELIR